MNTQKAHLLWMVPFLILTLELSAQSKSEDSLSLVQNMDWLVHKLTYNYYNIDDSEWWMNRFVYHGKDRSVKVTNIATDKIGKAGGKNYTQRSFSLSDMNPYTIKIEDQTINAGRLVKGKIVRLGVYHHDRKIRQTKNGKNATNQTSIYFSIPQFKEDSLANYSQFIADRFADAIKISTKLRPKNSFKENTEILISSLQDQFKHENGYWLLTLSFDNVLEVYDMDLEQNLNRIGYLRFSIEEEKIYLSWIYQNQPVSTETFTFGTNSFFELNGETSKWTWLNKNEITFFENGREIRLLRDWDFDRRRAYYR